MWSQLKTEIIDAEINENIECVFKIDEEIKLIITEIKKDIERYLDEQSEWKLVDWEINKARQELWYYELMEKEAERVIKKLLGNWDFKYK